ncbi:MAG: GspH/FimT family pseudopilin [Halothiobacillaceae bacterium]|nr:GspH/FimT family pseudopilin [Halothiobacillaceae bacterium]
MSNKIRLIKHEQGYTLLELMMTIAILAILIAVGIPSFQAFIASTQLTTQTNNILTALSITRTQAIKNNTRATLCTSDNGIQCTSTPWHDGWLIYVDSNQNSALDLGEEITTHGQPTNALEIRGNTNVAHRISYRADGSLFSMVGTIRICKASTAIQENARNIIINHFGRARTTRADLNGLCP